MKITITWDGDHVEVRQPYQAGPENQNATWTAEQVACLDVVAGALLGECVATHGYQGGLEYRATGAKMRIVLPVELLGGGFIDDLEERGIEDLAIAAAS